MKIKFLMLAFFCSILISCTKDNNCLQNADSSTKPDSFEFYGLLNKLEASSFMYGTHYIKNGRLFYALKSNTINLDAYVGKNVTISGTKISGYPVDGGPDFLDVKTVR